MLTCWSGHAPTGHYASAPLPPPLRHPTASTSSLSSTVSFPSSSVRGFGQPLPSTHPHLLQHGELTEGIPAIEYAERRKRLMDSLPERSVVILPGARLQYASGGIFYKFRQASDFYYLTGWLEHDAAVILGQSKEQETELCKMIERGQRALTPSHHSICRLEQKRQATAKATR